MPVGAVEQHGPHLPLATDTMIAAAVAHRAAERLVHVGGHVLVAPAIPYGASGEHEGFPGTISIGHEALHLVLVEYGRSACRWARGIVFVNGHGGNVVTMRRAVDELRHERRRVAWHACAPTGGDAHAGHTETSLLWHLAPAAVAGDQAEAGAVAPLSELLPTLRRQGVRAVTPNGVLGDPHGASAEAGERAFGLLVEGLVSVARELLAEQ